MDVAGLRAQIPVTQRLIYMNTGWSGPSPRPVVEAIIRQLELEAQEGPTARPVLEEKMGLFQRARQALARLLGADPLEIALTQNTTQGINIVLTGLPWSPGDEVVTCDLEHSSLLIPLYYLRRRQGVTLRIVSLDGCRSPEAVVERFAAAFTPRTRLLAISHIQFSNGLSLPLAELCRLAHSRGALVLVDGAQAVGQVPVEVRRLGCDFYAFPGHKWLLGPDGVGALYIRRELIPSLEPLQVAFGAAASYDQRGSFTPRIDSIHKFELTTQSGPLLAGLIAAIEFLEGIGLVAIGQRALALAELASRRLAAIPGVRLISPQERGLMSGLVCFSVEGVAPREATARLWEEGGIVARTVPETGSTRLSLHFFNTEEEVEVVARVVAAMAAGGPDGRERVWEEVALREL